jgi:NAD(P) transhydrogenase subunit beta
MLVTLSQIVVDAAGFIAIALFVYGLKRMSSPATAASGIRVAGIGMLLAVAASFLYLFDVSSAARPHLFVNLGLALVAMAIGGSIAWRAGKTVKMTAMPQMVAIYNGMGGGAAGAIAAVELYGGHAGDGTSLIVTLLGAVIGAVSLSGSLIAWAKLQGILRQPLQFGGQQILNAAIAVVLAAVAVLIFMPIVGGPAVLLPPAGLISLFIGLALVLGILVTLPIGGADMPVVISVYNACTGIAVALEGFVLDNPALMIAGMVVGAAGTLLTLLMAKAMNRTLSSVLFKSYGGPGKTRKHGGVVPGTERASSAADAAIAMRYAQSVIIVPGYGLAQSQGQQKLYDFVKLLVAAGVSVKFAIHPVAGRMPGQMDVLLAEAGVPYNMIFQLADINDQFPTTDVSLVIGANDVVNPAARTEKTSPVYGMPILNADQSKACYVIKRGQGKGYAGIVNALFYAPHTQMVYGDASAVLGQMIEAVRGLGAAAA